MNAATLFETDDNPREPSAPLSFSHRVSGETQAEPLCISPTPDEVDLTALYKGMQLLRMDPKPQQIATVRVLAARRDDGLPLYREVAVCEPRRASKTVGIWAELLGRCALIPGYQVVTTAQTGIKARERFMTVQRILARNNIGDFVVKKGAGAEAIEWVNGSRLWVVPPEGGAFRGDAADAILIDEAQEHGPEASADILGGALSLMDTRPSGQIVTAGTAGRHRSGMLWEGLERGRAGLIGVVEYAVPDGTIIALDVATAEGQAGIGAGWPRDKTGARVLNVPAILGAHPGIGTLTTLDTIADRFTGLGLPEFLREYGGQWPFDLNTRAISSADWEAGQVAVPPAKPARYALAFDVAPDQSAAALVAAWRDAAGIAWWEVIAHLPGDAGLPKAIFDHVRKHPNVKVGYDNIGPNQAIADRLNREARPRPKFHQLGTRDIVAAASTANQEITSRTLKHPVDAGLDGAADGATRRSIGDGSWAWGRRKSSGDISPLVAATNALKVYDMDPRNRTGTAERTRIVTPTRK